MGTGSSIGAPSRLPSLASALAVALLVTAGCGGGGDFAISSGSCELSSCGSWGECVIVEGSPVCLCDEGWHPESLTCVKDEDSCAGVTCSGQGICASGSDGAVCLCNSGYHREGPVDCVKDEDPCEGVDCSGHGDCAVRDEVWPECYCEEGWHASGLTCVEDLDPCEGVDCSGHGECGLTADRWIACACDEGHYAAGLACVTAEELCSLMDCGEGGECVHDGPAPRCECPVGYYNPWPTACAVGSSAFGRICNEDGWCWENPLPTASPFVAVWGSGANDVWAITGRHPVSCGDPDPMEGLILHWDGAAWNSESTGGRYGPYSSIHGSGTGDVWIAGRHGTVLVRSASGWRDISPDGSLDLHAVWSLGPREAWVAGAMAGEGALLRWNGETWEHHEEEGWPILNDLWVSPAGELWAAGEGGAILRQDDGDWTRVESGTTEPLWTLWGSAQDDIWAAGGRFECLGSPETPYVDSIMLLHWDGTSWKELDPGPYDGIISSIWGTGRDDAWAIIIDDDGHDLALHWDGNAFRPVSLPDTWRIVAAWSGVGAGTWAVGDGGAILHHDGMSWHVVSTQVVVTMVSDIWSGSPHDLWATTGSWGTLRRQASGRWTSPAPPYAGAIHGTSNADIWAVGDTGHIEHWDGTGWSHFESPGFDDLFDVFCLTPSNAGAVGAAGYGSRTHWNTLLNWDGMSWNALNEGLDPVWGWDIYGVWGSAADDVWAVGNGGKVLRFDGTTWSEIDGDPSAGARLRAVWGLESDDVWAVGEGTILHWNGSTWSTVLVDVAGRFFLDVNGTSADDVWIVGDGGLVLNDEGSGWTVVSDQMMPDLFAVLPLTDEVWVGGYYTSILRRDR